MNRSLLAALVLAAVVTGGSARASIIETSTNVVPADNYAGPDSAMGTVFGTKTQGQTGTVSGQYVSPFPNNTSQYVAVQLGSAEYYYNSLYNTLSLVWGSPDSYNKIYLYNNGSQVGTISGDVIGSSSLSYFVTLTSSLDFNRVEFWSDRPAFEFSNVQVATVPIPAGVSLLAATLGVLGLFAMARRRANSLQ